MADAGPRRERGSEDDLTGELWLHRAGAPSVRAGWLIVAAVHSRQQGPCTGSGHSPGPPAQHSPSCYRDGKLEIEHAGKCFSHLDALGEHLGGLAREAKLLRKLVNNNLADEQEKQRYQEALAGIQDAPCPCCGRRLTQILDEAPSP